MTTERYGKWTLTIEPQRYDSWSGYRMVVTHDDHASGRVDIVPNAQAFYLGSPLSHCTGASVQEMRSFLKSSASKVA